MGAQTLFSGDIHLNAATMLIAACCVGWLGHVGEAKLNVRGLGWPCVLWSFLLGASSLLPRRRGERAPERSDGQTHGWHAGPFCCWRAERLPTALADHVDAEPYGNTFGIQAAFTSWLLGRRQRDG